jgi:hypothetical protein
MPFITDPELRRIQSDVRIAQRENQDYFDTMWFRCGFYDLIGCDRQGNSFTTVDDDREAVGGYEWNRAVDEARKAIRG